MKILFLVTLVCLLAFAYAGKDLCSYDWCAKEELSGCEEGDKMTREACNRRGKQDYKIENFNFLLDNGQF